MKYGIRSVTMDEIAKELAISKKTIYQYFKDKREIVKTIMQCKIQFDKESIHKNSNQVNNALEEFLLISEHIRKELKSINPSLLNDLKKYYPEAWQMHIEHMESYVVNAIKNIILQGIEEGIFRKDLDAEVLSRMRIKQVEIGFDPSIFPIHEFDIPHIQMQFFDHFIYGICAKKGFDLFEQYKLNQQNEQQNFTQPNVA